jgi:hypothetical protein
MTLISTDCTLLHAGAESKIKGKSAPKLELEEKKEHSAIQGSRSKQSHLVQQKASQCVRGLHRSNTCIYNVAAAPSQQPPSLRLAFVTLQWKL